MNELLEQKLKSLNKSELCKVYNQLQQMSIDRNMQIGGTQIPFIKVPLLLEKNNLNSILQELNIVIDTLNRLEVFSLTDQGQPIYERLMKSLTPGGRRLVKQASFESDFSLTHRHRRVDGYLLSKGEMEIIEVNQAAPLAISFHDSCQDIASHLLNELEMDHSPNFLSEHLLEWFIAEFQHRYGENKFPKVIALPIEHGYPPKFSDLPNMARRIEKLAKENYDERLSIVVCFPYEIHLKNAKPFVDGKSIDLIWRNSVYMDEYRKQERPLEDYEKILSNPQEYLIINSSRAWLTRNKETFAVMWNDGLMEKAGFTKEELYKLRRFLPPTYNLKYDQKDWQKILDHKNEWISKPSDAGFGAGVEFGANMSIKEWEQLMIERSRQEGFVFQKRITYPIEEVLDITEDGELVKYKVELDCCPHHVNGSFVGSALSRANIVGDSKVEQKMNLVSGGHMLPLMMI